MDVIKSEKLLDANNTDSNFRLPLPPKPPMEFTTLPEHCIEDVAEFFLFICQYLI